MKKYKMIQELEDKEYAYEMAIIFLLSEELPDDTIKARKWLAEKLKEEQTELNLKKLRMKIFLRGNKWDIIL